MKENKKCTDKAAFATIEQAQAAATTAWFRYNNKPGVTPYLCKDCDLYHLTTKFEDDEEEQTLASSR